MAGNWHQLQPIRGRSYTCAYCGKATSPTEGYITQDHKRAVVICPFCREPTYLRGDKQFPSEPFGPAVEDCPDAVTQLFNEARNCMSVSAFTPAVLACRVILMHIAVEKGAEPKLTFAAYVKYLVDKHFVPPGGHDWVDAIREKGNEANHGIEMMTGQEAERILTFVQMLLRFIYEMPAKVKPAKPASGADNPADKTASSAPPGGAALG